MNTLAKKLLKAERRELLKFLRFRLRESDRATRAAAKAKDYGTAQLCEGLAQAYEFTILHVEGLGR